MVAQTSITIGDAESHLDDFGPFLNRTLIDPKEISADSTEEKRKGHNALIEVMNDANALSSFVKSIHSKKLGLGTSATSPEQETQRLINAEDLEDFFDRLANPIKDSFEYCYYRDLKKDKLETIGAEHDSEDGILPGFENFLTMVFTMAVKLFELTADQRPAIWASDAWKEYGAKLSTMLRNSFDLAKNFSLLHKDILLKFYEMNGIIFSTFKSWTYPLSQDYFQIDQNSLKLKAQTLVDIVKTSQSDPYTQSFGPKRPMLKTDVMGCPVMEIFTDSEEILKNGENLRVGGEELGKESYDWICDLLDEILFKQLDQYSFIFSLDL